LSDGGAPIAEGTPEGEPVLNATIRADGVAAPAMRAMHYTSEIVVIALTALEGVDFSNPPQIPGAFFHLTLQGSQATQDQRRAAHASWILSKGLQEIARGVRESLEAAELFIACSRIADGKTTIGKLQQLQKAANSLNFPDLLTRVNAGLTAPLQFTDEFLSLQKARNCLEHRNGIVAPADANHEGRALRLVLPRLELFVRTGGTDVELRPGLVVEGGGAVGLRRGRRERLFLLGSRITFDAAEFHEIGSACYFFATDLVAKLPRPPAGPGRS
jgi:hypothetical protein